VLVTLDQVQGRKGAGIHLLTIHLEVKRQEELVGCALAFSGQLSLGFSRTGIIHVGQLHASSTPPVFMPLQTGEILDRRVELSVDIAPLQLEAIEDARNGMEVELLLDVNGLLVGTSPAESFSGQLRYRLDAAMWTRLLEQMGFAKSIVLSIPLDGLKASTPGERETGTRPWRCCFRQVPGVGQRMPRSSRGLVLRR
jgi:hypothetical protein